MNKPFLEISAMSHCIHKCSYCPQNKVVENYKSEEKFLSLENFKIAILKLKEPSVIAFAGFSEPSSNKDIADMAKFASEQGHELMIMTTLYCLSKEQYDEFRQLNWSHFSVHVLDEDNKSDIKITDKYLDILKYVYDNPIPNIIYCHHSGDVAQEIKHLIPHSYLLEINSRADNLDCDDENVNRCYKSGRLVCGHRFLNGNSGLMLPSGDIQLCCSDFGLNYKLGNLLTDSWEDIQNSRVIKDVILDNANGNDTICRKCWLAKEI